MARRELSETGRYNAAVGRAALASPADGYGRDVLARAASDWGAPGVSAPSSPDVSNLSADQIAYVYQTAASNSRQNAVNAIGSRTSYLEAVHIPGGGAPWKIRSRQVFDTAAEASAEAARRGHDNAIVRQVPKAGASAPARAAPSTSSEEGPWRYQVGSYGSSNRRLAVRFARGKADVQVYSGGGYHRVRSTRTFASEAAALAAARAQGHGDVAAVRY